MQKSNPEIIRSIYDAAKLGDMAAVLSCLDPEIVAVEADSLPYGGTYHGHEGFSKLLGLVFQSWRSFEFDVHTLLDAGEYVLALMRTKIGLRGSDRDVHMDIAELWRLRDGKVTELRPYYLDTAALLDNART